MLGPDIIGQLAHSRTVIVPLPLAQRLTGHEGRLSQIMVAGSPARRGRCASGSSASRTRDRRSADAELGLLRQASQPNDQSTTLFAAISAMVGFLFAFNAILVTTAERRRFIADLRIQGFGPGQLA